MFLIAWNIFGNREWSRHWKDFCEWKIQQLAIARISILHWPWLCNLRVQVCVECLPCDFDPSELFWKPLRKPFFMLRYLSAQFTSRLLSWNNFACNFGIMALFSWTMNATKIVFIWVEVLQETRFKEQKNSSLNKYRVVVVEGWVVLSQWLLTGVELPLFVVICFL